MFLVGKQDWPYFWVLTLFCRDPCPSQQPPKEGGLNPIMWTVWGFCPLHGANRNPSGTVVPQGQASGGVLQGAPSCSL